ncbi:uncharacterized protein LOC129889189 [Solanum dulcamara]|uniref:uncharacterized protein LOC129889189 n=1 Tax=Solanum dulcamara TaxID=45834 RepID=UPI0024856275|nr:uncharacterized protein LOC129889189 [Solanum dulcamara]XP_055820361.1 uncharacterized protein LOC129889189 [Solanum dulcamara]XP_055820362.1 uncharacterized protein LOC129889189 [Solanum dulcamara]
MDNTSFLVDTVGALVGCTRVSAGGSQASDGLAVPQQGSSSVLDYVMEFLKWDGNNPTSSLIDMNMSREFIRGLSLPLCLASEHLILVGSNFPQIVSHVREVKHACFEAYKGYGNRIASHFRAIITSMRGQLPSQFINPTTIVPQVPGGFVAGYGVYSRQGTSQTSRGEHIRPSGVGAYPIPFGSFQQDVISASCYEAGRKVTLLGSIIGPWCNQLGNRIAIEASPIKVSLVPVRVKAKLADLHISADSHGGVTIAVHLTTGPRECQGKIRCFKLLILTRTGLLGLIVPVESLTIDLEVVVGMGPLYSLLSQVSIKVLCRLLLEAELRGLLVIL